ncbi:MAG TPA: HypC/HybG/HupF family hydrogenase formation chaperone [Burkholderiaceae bacterium]|jgi:hydrogenase expression/formation protein HypC|nr:HypC/HybG/HupF family hydrogenase formation chaperone [Burkholderiaceae bacterium]HNG82423.1 HypC/HybG/HupF family hydrogenase formation chaperone [Burkholderiaceae bacterium]
MCLALPACVIERLDGEELLIDLGGVRKRVSGALTPEAQVGDYVIVHVGHAIGVIDPEEAAQTLALFAELSAAEQAAAVEQSQ